MSTPHNRAEKGDFAKTVLMPGDPLRAKFIAETFLENPRVVTDVRGMLGYTGTYQREAAVLFQCVLVGQRLVVVTGAFQLHRCPHTFFTSISHPRRGCNSGKNAV